MVETQQDRMQIFEEKLQNKEYPECIITAQKLLESLKTMSQSDSAKIRIACYTAIGDANMGMKNFQEALRNYEKARRAAEDKYGVLAEESMLSIFKLEKAVRALSALEGGHDAKNILTNTVLLSAKSSEAASKLESGKHARTLQGLWAVALDKKIVRASNPFQLVIDTAIQTFTSSKAEEFLSRTSIVVSSVGLFGMLVYGFFWWATHPYTEVQNKVVHGDFVAQIQTHTKAKNQKWVFRPVDNVTALSWSQDGTADVTANSKVAKSKLPTVIYDGTPGSLLSVYFNVFTKKNLLLRWNGYAMQDQYSSTYYDILEPEDAVATKMYALRSTTYDFFKKHGRFPTPTERADLSYTNPFTKHSERVLAFGGKDNIGDLVAACKAQGVTPHPGLVVCVTANKRYLIGAFDRAKNPIQTPNANGFLSTGPNQKLSAPEAFDSLGGVVVFDKPVDQLFYLICAHTAFTWVLVFLLVGVVGPIFFLATRNWRNATRTSKVPPKPNTPATK
ncbi:MAG TPA: hypothetical protein V6C76_12060 [Drouetiella sp.]